MNLDLDPELLLEGIARGVQRTLAEAGFAGQIRDFLFVVEKLTLLKEGLLTPDQCAQFFGVSRRTFDRWVENGDFRKETAMGEQVPRFYLLDLIQKLQPGHIQAKGDVAEPELAAVASTSLIDLFPATVAAGKSARASKRLRENGAPM